VLFKESVAAVERPRTERLLYPVPEAAARLGIGRTLLYELIGSGVISAVKVHKRTLIAATELDRYVASLVGGDAA
jgi:excisionase family DNA binding protein